MGSLWSKVFYTEEDYWENYESSDHLEECVCTECGTRFDIHWSEYNAIQGKNQEEWDKSYNILYNYCSECRRGQLL